MKRSAACRARAWVLRELDRDEAAPAAASGPVRAAREK